MEYPLEYPLAVERVDGVGVNVQRLCLLRGPAV
jgi:hypothetical protein